MTPGWFAKSPATSRHDPRRVHPLRAENLPDVASSTRAKYIFPKNTSFSSEQYFESISNTKAEQIVNSCNRVKIPPHVEQARGASFRKFTSRTRGSNRAPNNYTRDTSVARIQSDGLVAQTEDERARAGIRDPSDVRAFKYWPSSERDAWRAQHTYLRCRYLQSGERPVSSPQLREMARTHARSAIVTKIARSLARLAGRSVGRSILRLSFEEIRSRRVIQLAAGA